MKIWDLMRFMSKVNSYGECWLWEAGKCDDGYGQFRLDGKTIRCHRLSYEHFHGPIPMGLQVRHTCDVRACVNPAHLVVGTNLDNVLDRQSRKRQSRGEGRPTAKLSYEIASEIRKIYVSRDSTYGGEALARRFGVDPSVVKRVVRGEIWKDSSSDLRDVTATACVGKRIN